ncbi:hypothetical protein [Maritalea porphyrae]|uniref:hypothetical protein n=1 Tax=Maritalea porphyrae TaxID=880732 RepID=UPI0022AF0855|nr:hypothetical protein [Maritalea porphyrae]MCZ4270755.1 hypothetical protein [Maritalea porphyrae]
MMIFQLTSKSLEDPEIFNSVCQLPDFMEMHQFNYDHAMRLQQWHDSQLERGLIIKPSVKMLREAHVFMKSASAFAVMHKDPDRFLKLMAEVNKRG